MPGNGIGHVSLEHRQLALRGIVPLCCCCGRCCGCRLSMPTTAPSSISTRHTAMLMIGKSDSVRVCPCACRCARAHVHVCVCVCVSVG
jgi:hypothetical protein